MQFDEGDVEMLPCEDNAFGLVVSLTGAMFAPRPERTAVELGHVCMPGGADVQDHRQPRPTVTAHGIAGKLG
ncbi:MAG: methyltransferase domain-containing protein [Armatimonadota bacterium]